MTHTRSLMFVYYYYTEFIYAIMIDECLVLTTPNTVLHHARRQWVSLGNIEFVTNRETPLMRDVYEYMVRRE